MTFTGTPVVKNVTDNCIRITGVSLINDGETGNIGFDDSIVPPGVPIQAPNWQPYVLEDQDISLSDMIQVDVIFVGAGEQGVVVRKEGESHEDFRIFIQNLGGNVTGQFEIYLSKVR